jgi:uncharacterized repeat protein (TIGR03943 family)
MKTMDGHVELQDGRRVGGAARGVLLAGLGALLLAKWRDGALDLYVHPAFVPILALTGAALLGLAAVQLWMLARQPGHVHGDDGHGHEPGAMRTLPWGLALLGLAVVIGALVPARPLGSAAAESQATELPPPALMALSDETEGWTLLEWAQALSGGVQRERLIGRRVSLVGFVHRPREGAAAGQFLVTRFVIRCCAADGLAVSLPVRHPDADTLTADTWVQVEGALRLADDGGRVTAFVEADRLTVVPAPATPYLTPT